MCYFIVIAYPFALKYNLNVFVTATVVKVDKAERLTVSEVAYPTAESDLLTRKVLSIFVYRAYKI